jgi:hypothetical protein
MLWLACSKATYCSDESSVQRAHVLIGTSAHQDGRVAKMQMRKLRAIVDGYATKVGFGATLRVMRSQTHAPDHVANGISIIPQMTVSSAILGVT